MKDVPTKLSVKQIIEKHLRSRITDEDVIHTLVELRRAEKRGSPAPVVAAIIAEIKAVHGSL